MNVVDAGVDLTPRAQVWPVIRLTHKDHVSLTGPNFCWIDPMFAIK